MIPIEFIIIPIFFMDMAMSKIILKIIYDFIPFSYFIYMF